MSTSARTPGQSAGDILSRSYGDLGYRDQWTVILSVLVLSCSIFASSSTWIIFVPQRSTDDREGCNHSLRVIETSPMHPSPEVIFGDMFWLFNIAPVPLLCSVLSFTLSLLTYFSVRRHNFAVGICLDLIVVGFWFKLVRAMEDPENFKNGYYFGQGGDFYARFAEIFAIASVVYRMLSLINTVLCPHKRLADKFTTENGTLEPVAPSSTGTRMIASQV